MKFYKFKNDSERKIVHQAAGLEGEIKFWPYFIVENGVGDYSEHNGLGKAQCVDTVEEFLRYINPFKAYCVARCHKARRRLFLAAKNSSRRIDEKSMKGGIKTEYFVTDDDAAQGAGFSPDKFGRRISVDEMIRWLEYTPAPTSSTPKYDIISYSEITFLIRDVNRKLLNGWVPQGGVTFNGHYYCQAIVLP